MRNKFYAWDIPRFVFDKILKKYHIQYKKEIILPGEKIFPVTIPHEGNICLQLIIGRRNSAVYFWPGETAKSYEGLYEQKYFSNLCRQASWMLRGFRTHTGMGKIDRVIEKIPREEIDLPSHYSPKVVADIDSFAREFLDNPRMDKSKMRA